LAANVINNLPALLIALPTLGPGLHPGRVARRAPGGDRRWDRDGGPAQAMVRTILPNLAPAAKRS
jgi:hypothetical protein